MPETTIQVPPFVIEAAVGTIDDEQRTVELVFSTGAPFARMDWRTGRPYNLKLSLNPRHVRLGRLNNGAPLLDSHRSYSLSSQLGVVVEKSAMVDGKRARCIVRFSRREEVEPIWQDVKDGIIRNVSVGATIHKFEEKRGADEDIPLRTAVDWEPFEVTLCPVGADDGAKVKAADQSVTNPCVVVTHLEEEEMSDPSQEQRLVTRLRAHIENFFASLSSSGDDAGAPPPAPTPAPTPPVKAASDPLEILRACREAGFPAIAESLIEAKATTEQVTAAIERAKKITELCEKAEFKELADSYIAGGMEPDAIRQQLATYAAKADGGEISGHIDPDVRATQKPRIDVAAIYAARNKRTRATQQES